MPTKPERELALFRLLANLEDRLEHARDADSALRTVLRLAREHFGAKRSCLAYLVPGAEDVTIRHADPIVAEWDRALIAAFLGGRRPRLPDDLLLGGVERRDRPWVAMCLGGAAAPFDDSSAAEIRRIAAKASKLIQRIDRLRLAEVRVRIDRKIMEQLRPQDLFYQILHGLRSLTGYDHSAALFTYDAGSDTLELVAEQIAWGKEKSRSIGREVRLDARAAAVLGSGAVLGFDRRGSGWRAWDDAGTEGVAATVCQAEADGPTERSMLCAPLVTRDGLTGLLKIASLRAGSLGRYESDLVQRFVPHAVVAIRNLQRAESLQAGMLNAERKQVLANVARGVAHDINNALGAVLPLVQQMREDLAAGRTDPEVMQQDLAEVESSVQLCRRIFGGMLAFQRRATHLGEGDVRTAVQGTLAVLADTMRRRSIRCIEEVPDELPRIQGPQGDLEQLLLNLVTNACDAMAGGGELAIRARLADGQVEIEIADTGPGIPPEQLPRIQEPFFTTKPHGNGLGLSICRSIVWENQGSLEVDSEPGRGTRVRVRLPAIA